MEPDARDYFIVDARVTTVGRTAGASCGRTPSAEGDRTRIVVEGRIPLYAPTAVMYRRVGDPGFYYGHTLRMLLRQRGIRVTGRVKRGTRRRPRC